MKQICFTLGAALLLVACTKDSRSLSAEQNNEPMARAARADLNGGRPLSTPMTGAEEAPNPGDPDGTGMVHLVLNEGQGTISFQLTVQNIVPATAAHIHRAPAGVAGPVVVGLAAPTSGMSSGTIENVSAELIREIRQNPSAFYVNVHNAVYPGGAVRGQLEK